MLLLAVCSLMWQMRELMERTGVQEARHEPLPRIRDREYVQERREAVRDPAPAPTPATMDCEVNDKYMFGDEPVQTTMDAKTAYVKARVQPGFRRRVAAAREHKLAPEVFAFNAIKEILAKEGLQNIPIVIKVAEKISGTDNKAGGDGAGGRYVLALRPGEPTGGKLRRR